MQLQLPRGLHYPITITELLKQPDDNVERFAPLFSYSYKTTVTEGNKFGDEFQVEKDFPTKFESSVGGKLKAWSINVGDVIPKPGTDIAEIEEPCAHGMQFGGMCTICGQDMTQLNYVTEQVDASRATINMVHDKTSLVVSPFEAARFEDEAKRRLLASKKLSLVVDLDQTVIQACVEPTIGEWMRNPENPNHEAVKDVREFQLVEDSVGTRGCWYYIKLRPGLEDFLETMSRLYEMHIYTMGTRGYAQKIAQIIDPHRKFFGDRILSRDESGSLVAKNLQRLFPVDTKMVLIIDDRGDVWRWNENLIKVTPYDFFVGIGDINSSFLPKKPGLPTALRPLTLSKQEDKQLPNGASDEPNTSNGNSGSESETTDTPAQGQDSTPAPDTSALEQLVSMGGGSDPLTLQEQTTRQDETLVAQLEERPLLKKQLQLEQDDAAKAAAATDQDHDVETNGALPDGHATEKPRHHILEDHDRQLDFLQQSLRLVHTHYYKHYDRQRASQQGGRVAEIRGSKRKQPANETSDLTSIPDVKVIMPSLKHLVLEGVVIVLSGVIPLGWDIQTSDLAMWAKSFGAAIEEEITKRTTHLIAARNRTAKVRQALKRGRGKIKIVGPQWLVGSLAQWAKLGEEPYLLDLETETSNSTSELQEEDQPLSESEAMASEKESGEEDLKNERAQKAKPILSITSRNDEESDVEGILPDDLEDQHSPVGGTNEDWDNMHAELQDFLGSEAEDSDGGESVSSVGSSRSSKSTVARRPKRVRELDDSADQGMRKRPAPSRRTNLSKTSVAANTTPEPSEARPAGKEGSGVNTDANDELNSKGDEEDTEDGEEWTELEQEFAAEMEKAAAEEGVGG
ncbi:MAG: hypothetical protein LQ343_002046 [Gyalolechia ehrenbergii]|nr:MAG: hypothetical protein LQ343_002046 [Gyalolechia ehrenbergii]